MIPVFLWFLLFGAIGLLGHHVYPLTIIHFAPPLVLILLTFCSPHTGLRNQPWTPVLLCHVLFYGLGFHWLQIGLQFIFLLPSSGLAATEVETLFTLYCRKYRKCRNRMALQNKAILELNKLGRAVPSSAKLKLATTSYELWLELGASYPLATYQLEASWSSVGPQNYYSGCLV